jgi:hypothetical protein
MNHSAIFCYEVPVDDAVHEFQCSAPLLVAASRRTPLMVEFWAYPDGPGAHARRFVVVGTGHPLPAVARVYRGGVITGGGSLVWHLLEIT